MIINVHFNYYSIICAHAEANALIPHAKKEQQLNLSACPHICCQSANRKHQPAIMITCDPWLQKCCCCCKATAFTPTGSSVVARNGGDAKPSSGEADGLVEWVAWVGWLGGLLDGFVGWARKSVG